MLALPGLGIVLHRSATKNADAMARCLADVAARIPEDAPTSVLTVAEERELMNWEAESLPTVDRQMSLRPDACMRYRN